MRVVWVAIPLPGPSFWSRAFWGVLLGSLLTTPVSEGALRAPRSGFLQLNSLAAQGFWVLFWGFGCREACAGALRDRRAAAPGGNLPPVRPSDCVAGCPERACARCAPTCFDVGRRTRHVAASTGDRYARYVALYA